MRDTLLALLELSKIDSRVLDLERSAAAYPAQIAELEKGLEEIRTELGNHNSEYEARVAEQAEAEVQIREESAKLQKWRRRLHDIKSPREYQALSREVEGTERQIKGLEESVLTAMEELEGQRVVIGELEKNLKEKEANVQGQINELRTQQRKADAEIKEASKDRPQVATKVPERVLKLYERIRKRRGVAVALTDGKCHGCNFVVRPQQMVEIRHLNTLEQCPQCNRILILASLDQSGMGEQPDERPEAR